MFVPLSVAIVVFRTCVSLYLSVVSFSVCFFIFPTKLFFLCLIFLFRVFVFPHCFVCLHVFWSLSCMLVVSRCYQFFPLSFVVPFFCCFRNVSHISRFKFSLLCLSSFFSERVLCSVFVFRCHCRSAVVMCNRSPPFFLFIVSGFTCFLFVPTIS